MEHVYSVKLAQALGIQTSAATSNMGGGSGSPPLSVLDLVPNEYHNQLRLVDWSYNGLIAVAANVAAGGGTGCSNGFERAAKQNQQPVITIFDCNEPQAVAVCSPLDCSTRRRAEDERRGGGGGANENEEEGHQNGKQHKEVWQRTIIQCFSNLSKYSLIFRSYFSHVVYLS